MSKKQLPSFKPKLDTIKIVMIGNVAVGKTSIA